MCGIFGEVGATEEKLFSKDFCELAKMSTRRGTDASGLVLVFDNQTLSLSDTCDVEDLLDRQSTHNLSKSHARFGFSRMITNSESESQPVRYGNILVLHNGIVTNFREIEEFLNFSEKSNLDSSVIPKLIDRAIKDGLEIESIASFVLSKCIGQVSVVCFLLQHNKILLFSNNGSLFIGQKNERILIASEYSFLKKIDCKSISKIIEGVIIDCKFSSTPIQEKRIAHTEGSFVKEFNVSKSSYKNIDFTPPKLARCRKCVLPSTMPFIDFDQNGECNYCRNFKSKIPKQDLLEDFRAHLNLSKDSPNKVLIPISGGRDSCFVLAFVKETLGLDAIAFTYDWGFVTDLARRNISRMCGELGVEHILVAKDIKRKRRNVNLNLHAWLAKPDLGMLSILTAGDKHFFKYADEIAKETSSIRQIWGTNSLEQTHFKSGFLGVKPLFDQQSVYTRGVLPQLNYHSRRLLRFVANPRYLNVSLFDTYEGEFYRSIVKRTNYSHLFDYICWNENRIDTTLKSYGWETSPDTSSSWRIGDATAAFYNYVYLRIAGFTESDTFRSNQIREGLITREEALRLITADNMPRPASIKWYLDTVGMDFESVIRQINATASLYGREG